MDPCWAVTVKVPDEVLVLAQFSAMRPSDIIDPFFPLRAIKVEVTRVLLPLVGLCKWEQMTEGHIEKSIFVIREWAGMSPSSYRDVLYPSDSIKAPFVQIRCY